MINRSISNNFFIIGSFSMDSITLSCVLSRDPFTKREFLGCFASDQLPFITNNSKPCCFIVNTDKSSQPGAHWFGVYVRRSNVYVFDSFGTMPRVIRKWCCALARPVHFNAIPHQSMDEVTCGGYAVYALCELARGRRFNSIVRHFLHTRYDDAFIRDYLARVHGVHIPSDMPL